MKPRLAVTVRAKVMGTVLLVSLLVLGVASVVSYYTSRAAQSGTFLERHYNRFDGYRRGLGRTIAALAAYIAADEEVVQAFDADDVERQAAVATHAARSLSTTAAPDLILFEDRRGRLVAGTGLSSLSAAEVRSSSLLGALRSGVAFDAELAVLGGRVYQVSGAPITNAQGTVVGGIVLGELLSKFFTDFKEQSDSDPTRQHRLTLLGNDKRVVVTVFPGRQRDDLAAALDPSQYVDSTNALGNPVKAVKLGDELWDFYSAEVRGYTGGSRDKIGTIFLMRRNTRSSDLWDRLKVPLLVFTLAGLLALLVGYMLSVGITRPIQRYVRATEDLARGRGDLTKRLDESSRDELGRLASNLNSVFAHIQELAQKVQRAAFQVGASSAEISAASKQMLDGAREQAKKTESSTAAVTELSASIQQVAENAMEATRVAKSSGEAVQGAIERMNQIRATVEEAAARIAELGESGKRIGNIVEVIRQISDQTTLLALNAAIEAAHAGEQGRGFAVVADEVSSLAKRVGQSARDIEDLIATIKEQTAEAVRTMTTGTREVEAGTTLVAKTLADLQKLVQVVQDTATAVQEQAVASDEIARNMDVVQKIAQEVLGSSEEAVEQGDHLHKLAHQLEESVKGFRTDGARDPALDAPIAELPSETPR